MGSRPAAKLTQHLIFGRDGGFAAALLVAASLAGCALPQSPSNAYTETGEDLGPIAFHPIARGEGKVSFAGEDPVREREAQSLGDRYSERITFGNGAMMRYDKLIDGGFTGSWSDADSIAAEISGNKFYKNIGISFDPGKLKSGGYYTYFLQSSPLYNCFVFRGTFGDVSRGPSGNRGDQEIIGNVCYKTGLRRLDALEREMTEILARARFDDGEGNRTRYGGT